MQEGMYLGAPPVNIARSAAATTLATMMRGGASYANAAGLGAPLAMPALQPGLPAPPANPQSQPQLAVLYPVNPALAKLNLRRRFGIGA